MVARFGCLSPDAFGTFRKLVAEVRAASLTISGPMDSQATPLSSHVHPVRGQVKLRLRCFAASRDVM